MKMLKRIVSVLLVCCVMAAVLPVSTMAASFVESGERNDNRTMLVMSEDGMTNSNYLNIDLEDKPDNSQTTTDTEIPPIDIAVLYGNVLTNRTYTIGLNQETIVAVAVDTAIWQETTKYMLSNGDNGREFTAFFSLDSLGNYYYLQEDTIEWKITGDTGCVSTDLLSKGALSLRGVQTGTVTLTVTALCGYATSLQGEWLENQGTVGVISASATIEVKPSSAYHNPFAGLDLDNLENPFIDVPSNAWYCKYACALYAVGMYEGVDTSPAFDGSSILGAPLSGNGSSTSRYSLSGSQSSSGSSQTSSGSQTYASTGKYRFHGSEMETRANTVVVMYNGHSAIGGSVASYTSNPFKDVGSGKTYYQPVLWASANSIVNGYGNGKFGPADGITREQFCAILLRYAEYAGITLPSDQAAKSFTDGSQISSWAKNAVVACQKAGIVNGYEDGSFRPKNGISRAEVSKMIFEFYNALP